MLTIDNNFKRVYKVTMITYKPNKEEQRMLAGLARQPEFNTFAVGCKAELVNVLIHTNDDKNIAQQQGAIRMLEQLRIMVENAEKHLR